MSQRVTKDRGPGFYAVPGLGVVIGLAYLAAAWAGGHPGTGAAMLAIMLVFSGAVLLASRRSETVRHLLDRRDERITQIDLRATAFAGTVVIVALLAAFISALARDRSTSPYDWLCALAGGAYLLAVVALRIRR